jgi:hypothetical protein
MFISLDRSTRRQNLTSARQSKRCGEWLLSPMKRLRTSIEALLKVTKLKASACLSYTCVIMTKKLPVRREVKG